ncbi:PREDICTED: alkaline ceramidase [Bactrocera latifrons]|uniref:Alkaline ceramidase n=3 Tax=Bactrocera TaxID=47832 RepID=A0A034VBN0_BACDO|nr:alkaline ceramidase [Bactrocera dorsalis]XP_018783281.1 PREDICTED: alkaline ceramidase [Bactrocera latifrons]XP_039952294.1 alkaline ceramidase [Bactrocera tryoni]XP_050319190.1 alkaline ceramidase [Bactrocera neohumeralis]
MAWEHGSSPVDWCEGNYLISSNIAEFVNTTSNFLFLLLPPVLICLFKEYGRFVTPGIHVLWVLLIIVGLSSMYFHATLSLIGQLLDELAILWVFMAAYSLFFPKKYYPKVFRNDRKTFSVFMFLSAIFATGMSIWKPIVNAFVLMAMGVPTMIMMYRELQRVRDQRVYRLGLRCTAVWLVAVFCWINDRMFCDAWSAINFPYLHGFWHIFIFIAAYTVLVLYAYFYVETELPQRQPMLKYWPKNDFEFGIPFIYIRNPGMTIKSAI